MTPKSEPHKVEAERVSRGLSGLAGWTPGPWRSTSYDATWEAACVEHVLTGNVVADVFGKPLERAEANAKLIALAPDMAARITALEAQNATLRDALERIGDQKMWFNLNGELVWTGETPDGNEIETEDPRDIARAALATPPEER